MKAEINPTMKDFKRAFCGKRSRRQWVDPAYAELVERSKRENWHFELSPAQREATP